MMGVWLGTGSDAFGSSWREALRASGATASGGYEGQELLANSAGHKKLK